MKRIFRDGSVVVEGRFFWASIFILATMFILLVRLWFLQVYRGEHYRVISENNRMRKIEVPAPRGLIFDRDGELLLGNRPFNDLVVIPQFVDNLDETLAILSRLLHIQQETLAKRYNAARGRPQFLPIILKRNLSIHEVAVIETNKIFLPGVDIAVAPRREYQADTPSHMMGYLGEISPAQLKAFNARNQANPYMAGDLIGKQGLEARWEANLRGRRGYRLIQVDAFGRQLSTSDRNPMELPELPAEKGADLVLTIDSELQRAAINAFNGKNGAVIVMRPQDGQVLAMVSEPGYDPTIYQEGLSHEEWRSLVANPFHPLLDKTTGGEFAPGSMYKTVVAMAALEEGIVTPGKTYFCPGHYQVGNETYNCHIRTGHGWVALREAIMKSCDVYFYHLGVELGVDRIAKYAKLFGLGDKLGFGLNMERPGLVPTSAWKKLTYRVPWAAGETPPIAIGQGYNLMTPLQVASLFSTIANGGNIWRPYLVQKVVNNIGKTQIEKSPELIRAITEVKPETFRLIRDALESVVMDPSGTGKKAAVPGITVAGKTGSVQVVSLKKNFNQTDVSLKWKEHAMFASFSPTENAEIAVVIVSEHDKDSGGGKSAAPVAGAILNAYWNLKKKRDGLTISKSEVSPTVVSPATTGTGGDAHVR